MNNAHYPKDTDIAFKLDRLIKIEEDRYLTERMSSRMIKCASVLDQGRYIGWQMYAPSKGLSEMSVFGSKSLCRGDLEWIMEKTAKVADCADTPIPDSMLKELYEIYLPISETWRSNSTIGFGSCQDVGADETLLKWPSHFSKDFVELMRALRSSEAILRVVVGPANEEEQNLCRELTLKTYDIYNIPFKDYMGRPVKMRVLLRIPSEPSIRLKTVIEELVEGAMLRYLGDMSNPEAEKIWSSPLDNARVLPDYAARILLMEPVAYESVIGIEVCEEEVKPIPASHMNTKDKNAVMIGTAWDTAGLRRPITIGEMDLRRHYQIVGQTGTGKSTVLSTLILSSIAKGHGLTFFDPHGDTINVVLHSLPEKYASRVRVVHIGDCDNPVPMNIWDSDDPEKEERNINDLCDLFGDIFDPRKQGFLGPRWERWFATFAKASIAFLGRRASLESIAVISQSQNNMLKVSKILVNRYPQLVETIKQEYGTDNSSDFQNMLNWYLCKFQRLTGVESLRKTLGAGEDALDFTHSIDTDTVTLIDLASPEIGQHAARIVGTLLLMKLWKAAMKRKERSRTHLVVVDEAALFQTNPMPRMLAESRKFGVSMVLSHQYAGQMSDEIRDALEANSANFSAFRLSPRDANTAAIRFDSPEMQVSLTRLNAFNAITTLSVDGKQSAPFTLETNRPKLQENGERIAARIEKQSIETLVTPYRKQRALTSAEILDLLDHPEKLSFRRILLPSDLREPVEGSARSYSSVNA